MQRQESRKTEEERREEENEGGKKKAEGMGPLFGGIAALQAMGQMILGVRTPSLSFYICSENLMLTMHRIASRLRCPLLLYRRSIPQSYLHARRSPDDRLARSPPSHPRRTFFKLFYELFSPHLVVLHLLRFHLLILFPPLIPRPASTLLPRRPSFLHLHQIHRKR